MCPIHRASHRGTVAHNQHAAAIANPNAGSIFSMAINAPKIVEYHFGSSDIIQSMAAKVTARLCNTRAGRP